MVQKYMNMENIQSAVSKTLLIPLAARALEMKLRNPVVCDKKAAEILAQIDVGGNIVEGGSIATHGILARTKVIDDEINKMLVQNPCLTVINLGAGLDTRISRIDNGSLRCFEVDLPDVIALRRKFFVENERIRFIAGSVLDSTWIREIGGLDTKNTVIVAEGLLMYFSMNDVRKIFCILAEHLHGAIMFFDAVHSYFVGKGITTSFQWGIDRANEIERQFPNIHLVRSWSIGDVLRERQPFIFNLLNVLPGTKNRSQILQIRFLSN
jgi:O-methyltransferase involved in polyketide biosynthesis